jgi:hypothetical protein
VSRKPKGFSLVGGEKSRKFREFWDTASKQKSKIFLDFGVCREVQKILRIFFGWDSSPNSDFFLVAAVKAIAIRVRFRVRERSGDL